MKKISKIKQFLIVLPLLFFAIMPAQGIEGVAPGTSLLANHSFETGGMSSWTQTEACTGGTETQPSTAPVPDGTLKYNLVRSTGTGSCNRDQSGITASASAWQQRLQDMQYYAHMTGLDAGECSVNPCQGLLTMTFAGDTYEVDVNWNLLNLGPGSGCTTTAWTGTLGQFCFDISASCLNVSNAAFCLYEDLDFYDDINALCAPANCMNLVANDANVSFGIDILIIKNDNTAVWTTEYDDIFFGCATVCEPPEAPVSVGGNLTAGARSASGIIGVVMLAILAGIVLAQVKGQMPIELLKAGMVVLTILGIMLLIVLAIAGSTGG